MPRFSKSIIEKIRNTSSKNKVYISPIAKSSSSIQVGDVLIFKYKYEGTIQEKVVVTVKPVEKDAKTGNSLLTCVKITLANELTPQYIKSIYNLRSSFGEDQYRTYIMTKIIGNIYKFSSFDPIED